MKTKTNTTNTTNTKSKKVVKATKKAVKPVAKATKKLAPKSKLKLAPLSSEELWKAEQAFNNAIDIHLSKIAVEEFNNMFDKYDKDHTSNKSNTLMYATIAVWVVVLLTAGYYFL